MPETRAKPGAGPAQKAEAGRPVVFVVPPGRPPSGGDLYNRFLLRALRAAGFVFETTTLPRLEGEAGTRNRGTEYWVDSLYIPALAARPLFKPRDRLFFIIHSLPSADPGLAPEKAAELRLAEDRLFAEARGFLVTGPWMREVLDRRGRRRVPVLLVPPAACVRPEGPLIAPEIFTGLIVSSLIRGKGVPEFLDELGREVRTSDVFAVRIAGRTDIEPETAAACLDAIAAHPLLRRSVRHLGFIPYEDLGDEYRRSSVLVSPSSSESFGMAFHEARAFGLPILAVRAPYSEPFIEEGRTGLLFETAAELAGGTLELARDPVRARALAGRAAGARPASTAGWDDAARSFLTQRASVL